MTVVGLPDELFGKVDFLIKLLEGETGIYVPDEEDDFDFSF